MKEILIVSGKGGAGKTSLCASFARLAQNTVLVDCDVDASDLHLLLKPEVHETHPFTAGFLPEIDAVRCIRCGKCASLCRFAALETRDGLPELREEACEGCGVCATHCPAGAIEMLPRDCGEWYDSTTANGRMFHARLLPGGENSGKLVSEIRRAAREYANETNAEQILLDGPPGIGCPVISAMTGVDLAVIVTEPTVSGLHDLKRMLELVKNFETNCAVLLNKADLNREISLEIRNFCAKNGIETIGAIPFDPLFVQALREGKTVADFPDSVPGRNVIEIWNRIEKKEREKETC